MDSGNSGSIQSSSGGDEEYDSHADSISSFLSNPGSLGFPSRNHHPPPSASSFDHLSTYLDVFSRPPTPFFASSNPILGCTGTGIGGLVGSAAPSPSPSPYSSFPTPVGPSHAPYAADVNMGPLPSPPSSSQQLPSADSGPAAPPRRSKKRSRASRRAPTTVLTTNTSNFRAMVQEFTGVPSPPFASPAFPRPRYDWLCTSASAAPRRSPGMADALPGYLLRPFAQKVPVSFASGSSSASSSAFATVGDRCSTRNVTTTTITESTGAGAARPRSSSANTSITSGKADVATTASITSVSTSTTTGSRHNLPSDLRLGSQHQSMLSVFNLQSLLPRSPSARHSPPSAPNHDMENSQQVAAAAASYGTGKGAERGHGSAHLGTLLHSIAASEGASSLGGGGDAGREDVLGWFQGLGGTGGGGQGQFRPIGGGSGDRQRGRSCKLNCTGPSSPDYHQEKGPENVATRGEGVVDSWICSSD